MGISGYVSGLYGCIRGYVWVILLIPLPSPAMVGKEGICDDDQGSGHTGLGSMA